VAAPRELSGPATPRLRAWQRAALDAYRSEPRRRDFLVTATPGSGKTTFALTLARTLIADRIVDRVIVVCPTDHLRTQWADAADAAGLPLDPSFAEQKKIFERCKGIFYACAGGAEARRFNRMLMNAGLIKGL